MTTQSAATTTQLPHQGDRLYIADGGLETTFVFQKDVDLPLFAAFHLLNSDSGIDGLKDYYKSYIDIARRNKFGVVLDTPTWRASAGWGEQLGYSADDIRQYNQISVEILKDIKDQYASSDSPMIINGAIGPQDDGYNPAEILSIEAAQQYHAHQIAALAEVGVEMVTAVTMTYIAEAIGITRAAKAVGIPVAVSFTVETDGKLPDGTLLKDAISIVDIATEAAPVYYMINCAHPSHFEHVLEKDSDWMDRVVGIRANASCKSHAELDEAIELDDGNPVEFGQDYARLNRLFKNLRVMGGCCGTDHRHIDEVCKSVTNNNQQSFAA